VGRLPGGVRLPRQGAGQGAACGRPRPDDFAALRNKLAIRFGPYGLGRAIHYIRCVGNNGSDHGLADRPVRYGPSFKKPGKKTVRLLLAGRVPKLLTADEIRRVLDNALPPCNAKVLLGINRGFGNTDCGNLPRSAVNLDAATIDLPRPKTGIPRRCPLWPESVVAVREALVQRPGPKKSEHAGLAFITRCGDSWAKETAENPVSDLSARLLRKLGINGRKGLGFYTLRHAFRTVANEAKDQPAADFILGHEVPHMASVYRETVSDAGLKDVAEHLRKWLFADRAGAASAEEGGQVYNSNRRAASLVTVGATRKWPSRFFGSSSREAVWAAPTMEKPPMPVDPRAVVNVVRVCRQQLAGRPPVVLSVNRQEFCRHDAEMDVLS
jgi:hypothetical protein